MIYNTRNWSNDTTENQKDKTCFNAHFLCSQSKIMGLCKMSLKSLAHLGRLAHLVSWFTCNTGMIVNLSSSPLLSSVK